MTTESENVKALLAAAKALVDVDCQYTGRDIVITCTNYGDAIKRVSDLRRAIARVEKAA